MTRPLEEPLDDLIEFEGEGSSAEDTQTGEPPAPADDEPEKDEP